MAGQGRLQRRRPRRAAIEQLYTAVFILLLEDHVEAPQAMQVLQHVAAALIQWRAFLRDVAQCQRAVTAQIHVPDLNVRLMVAQVVLR